MNGVFQGVGQNNSQFAFINRQGIGKGNGCFHPDTLALGLVKVGGKHCVQDRRAAPANLLVLVQPLLGRIQKVQGCLSFPTGHQLFHGLKLVAQVVALNPDVFLYFFYPMYFFLQ